MFSSLHQQEKISVCFLYASMSHLLLTDSKFKIKCKGLWSNFCLFQVAELERQVAPFSIPITLGRQFNYLYKFLWRNGENGILLCPGTVICLGQGPLWDSVSSSLRMVDILRTFSFLMSYESLVFFVRYFADIQVKFTRYLWGFSHHIRLGMN